MSPGFGLFRLCSKRAAKSSSAPVAGPGFSDDTDINGIPPAGRTVADVRATGNPYRCSPRLARPKGFSSPQSCQTGYHHMLHLRHDLLQREGAGVEDARIGRRPQRRVAARAVAAVAGLDLAGQGGLVHRLAPPAKLQGAPPRPHARIGGQVELDLGVREDDGPDVAALHHHPAGSAELPLERDQVLPHHRTGRDARREFPGVGAADRCGEIDPVDGQPCALVAHLEAQAAHQAFQRVVVVQRDAALVRDHPHGAVHRARVDVRVAEPAGERTARAALARAGGAVDRDHDPPHHPPSTRAPSPARLAKNPGNETLTHSGSAISMPPSARRPATANAMAMRWSPAASMRPPRSVPPPSPRSVSPSPETSIATPSGASCSSAARRSLSFTRSSPAPLIRVSPSASAAAIARRGSSSIAAGTSSTAMLVPCRRDARTTRSPRGSPASSRRPSMRTSAPMRRRMWSAPVRVGLSPTPRSRTSEPGTRSAATTRNAADDGSPGTGISAPRSRWPPRSATLPSVRSTCTPRYPRRRSVWSRLGSGSRTIVRPRARRPASRTADLS